ncbi:hypothetical protein [Thiolapillus sp.]
MLPALLFAIISVLVVSCRGSGVATKFEIFEGGQNVSLLDLKKESSEQLSYEVQLSYPNIKVLDFYSNILSSQGWTKCKPDGKWSEQIKKEGAQFIGTRHLVSYFFHSKRNKLLMLGLRYFSEPVQQLTSGLEWKNNKQHVTLIVYGLKNRNKVLRNLSLECGGSSPRRAQ